MDSTLAIAIAEVIAGLEKPNEFVRLVLSGRRRNMQTPTERVDVKPVLIKDAIKYQLSQSDGRAMTTKNYDPSEFIALNLLEAGFANILLEIKNGSISIRITKKGEALVHRTNETFEVDLSHDRAKARLLDPNDPFLIEIERLSDKTPFIDKKGNYVYYYFERMTGQYLVTKNNIIEEQDVLRWGYANWGVEKVTSEYKPQEIK